MVGPLDGPWLIAGGLAIVAVVAWRSPRAARSEIVLAAVLCVAAAALRFVYGVWGPVHVNGQGPLWIRGALDASVLAGSYGPGYFELFGWMARHATAPDTAVFAANALLSALSPGILYATARLVGVERAGALGAGVVLAADPVIVRTAASESYFASLIALILAVQAALGLFLRAEQRRDRRSAVFALVAVGLLAAAAARIHPSGYFPLAFAPLVVLSSAQLETWRVRVARTAAAAAAIGSGVLLTAGTTVLVALRAPIATQTVRDLPHAEWWVALVALAALWIVHLWARPPWLPLLGACSLLAMLVTRASFQQHPAWKLMYERLFWPGMLLGAAAVLPRRLQSPVWAIGGAAAVTAAALTVTPPVLSVPTTEQLEYRFLRTALRDMPPDCTLAGVSRADKRLWDIPSYLAPGASAQRAVESAADLAAAPGNCLLYVRSSLCSSAEARSMCESVERDANLERVASSVFPAVPSYEGLPYDRSEVETAVFRVLGHRAGVSDGIAITPAFAQTLYARATALRALDGCRVVGLNTSRFRMTVPMQAPTGNEYAVEFATAPRGSSTAGAEGWSVVAPVEAERECAATLAALKGVLTDIGPPAAEEAKNPNG